MVTKVLIRSFIVNTFLSIFKIISGFISNSGALIADGIHSLSDTITDVFSILGNKLSLKPADEKHPMGHGKIEYITCLFIGIMVTFMGFSIIYNAILGDITIPSFFALFVSILVIIMKFLLAKYILNKGNEYDSNILIASGKESFSDVISSFVVLISIILSQFSSEFHFLAYSDKIAMIIVGFLILRIAFNILKENLSSLIGEQITDKKYIEDLEKIILENKLINKIDKLIVLKFGNNFQVICEVSMKKNIVLKKVHSVLEKIEVNLKKYDERIKYINIHVNPSE